MSKVPVIIDACRVPTGRGHKDRGWLRDIRGDDLAVITVKALVKRALEDKGIDPAVIEEVIFGCVMQQEELGINVGRIISLTAGLPFETTAYTVNRLCSSSMEALHHACKNILSGYQDVQIVGGVEHMGHIPMGKDYKPNPAYAHRYHLASLQMGITAEFLSLKYNISRKQQDEFAFHSHRKAEEAYQAGKFKDEIIPVYAKDEDGKRFLCDKDQCIRPDTTMEGLAALKPAFNPQGGSVTAGNSSPFNDGATAMLVMSEDKAKELGLKPLVKVIGMATAGVDPAEMGYGPKPATEKVLKQTGLKLEDFDTFEMNEAFAVQTLSVAKGLGIIKDEKIMNKINPNGGAVALGHALGQSGARIMTTLVHEMKRQGYKRGLANMCIGVGMGAATVVEAV